MPEIVPKPGHECCDFCGDLGMPHVWIGPDNFVINLYGGGIVTSSPEWAACEECHTLLLRNDWEGILKRALVEIKRKNPRINIARAAANVRENHSRLRKDLHYSAKMFDGQRRQ